VHLAWILKDICVRASSDQQLSRIGISHRLYLLKMSRFVAELINNDYLFSPPDKHVN
jgi:hypothetical protein